MGGGDLNLKKSWHPHTMKNQKRVYEAEQANAAERRKMQELQQEIQNERNFEELKRIGQSSGVLAADEKNRLEWMYKGAENALNREEYLTGRAVDKHFEQQDKIERQKDTSSLVGVTVPKNHVEHECIPFSIRAFSGAPSSEEQVDLQRKIMEDPLMMIQQREMEKRQKLLQNPVKLKEIHRLLQQDKKLNNSSSSSSHKKKKKSKKSKKKHSHTDSDGSDDLDSQLAKKYKKLLGTEKSESMSIDKLLNEKYEKLSSELDKIKKSKKKEKKGKKDKKKKRDSSSDSSDSSSTKRREKNGNKTTGNAHNANKRLTNKGREPEPNSRGWSNRDTSPHRGRNRERDRRSRSPYKPSDQRRNRSPHQSNRRSRSPERRHRSRSRSPRREPPPSNRYSNYHRRDRDSSRNRSNRYTDRTNRSRSRSVSPRRRPNRRHSRTKSRSPSKRTNDSKSGHSRKISRSPKNSIPQRKESSEHPKPESIAKSIGVAPKPHQSAKKSSSSSSSSSSSGSSSESNSDSDNDRKVAPKNYGLVTAGGDKIEIDKNELAKSMPATAPKKAATAVPSMPLQPKKKLTDEEKEARLREMQQNAQWHDNELHVNRKRNEERARRDAEDEKTVEFDRNYIHKEMHKALNNQDSVEARLKSNKNNIQRLSSSMHSHFAKK